MSLQPKTRKYRLSFRNKTRILNDLPFDVRIRKLRNKNSLKAPLKQGCPEICSQRAHAYPFGEILNRKLLSSFTGSEATHAFTKVKVSQITMLTKNTELSRDVQDLAAGMAFPPLLFREGKFGKVLRSAACCLASSVGVSNSNSAQQLLKFKLDLNSNLINEQIDSSSLKSSQKSLTMAPHTSSAIDKVRFGACGFYFCNSGTITAKFIETIRLIVARKLKKTGRFWIRVCPDTPVTARSAETRMGRGKGAISHYEAKVRPGQMFIEFSGVPEESVRQIYQQVLKKAAIPITLLY